MDQGRKPQRTAQKPNGKGHVLLPSPMTQGEKRISRPVIDLDNNLIENKIRHLALGRKNYLFAGNHKGAERIAIIYSFFATCKIHDVNPWEWLKDVLERLLEYPINQIRDLLPNKWKKSKELTGVKLVKRIQMFNICSNLFI